MNYYAVSTKNGREVYFRSNRNLRPTELKDNAYVLMLDIFDDYYGPDSDPFQVVMECGSHEVDMFYCRDVA